MIMMKVRNQVIRVNRANRMHVLKNEGMRQVQVCFSLLQCFLFQRNDDRLFFFCVLFGLSST